MKAKLKHPGTIPTDGEKVRRLRQAKHWSQKTLSNRAGCSVVTIRSIEAGKEAFPTTLEKIARPLGVDYRELMIGTAEPAKEDAKQSPPQPSVVVLIYINNKLMKVDETKFDLIVQAIQKVAEIADDIPVLAVREGSVVIETSLSPENSVKLLISFMKNDLADFRIYRIRLFLGEEAAGVLVDLLARFRVAPVFRQKVVAEGGEITISRTLLSNPTFRRIKSVLGSMVETSQLTHQIYGIFIISYVGLAVESFLLTRYFFDNEHELHGIADFVRDPAYQYLFGAILVNVFLFWWGFDFKSRKLRPPLNSFGFIGSIFIWIFMKILRIIAFNYNIW